MSVATYVEVPLHLWREELQLTSPAPETEREGEISSMYMPPDRSAHLGYSSTILDPSHIIGLDCNYIVVICKRGKRQRVYYSLPGLVIHTS